MSKYLSNKRNEPPSSPPFRVQPAYMLYSALVTSLLRQQSLFPHSRARFRSLSNLDCPNRSTHRNMVHVGLHQGTEVHSLETFKHNCLRFITSPHLQMGYHPIIIKNKILLPNFCFKILLVCRSKLFQHHCHRIR